MQQSKLHVVVTGAGRGIGSAIATTIAGHHRLTLLGRNQRALQNVVSSLPNDDHRTVVCDMCSIESIESVCSRLGHVDVLVANAGIAEFGDVCEMSYETAQRQIETNLLGPIAMIHRVLPSMVERKQGMVVTINSVAATTVFRGAAAYAASKAGLLAYMRCLRQEVRSHGIKVVDLIVGATETEIWSEESRHTHGHRMMTAQHVAGVVSNVIDHYRDDRMMIEEITIRPQLGDL